MIRIGVCGTIGYPAAKALVKMHREEVEGHFSRRFMDSFDRLEQGRENKSSETDTVNAFGGLFGTIWRSLEMLEEAACVPESPIKALNAKTPAGCRIWLEKIPVKQEITEICELYGENPYEADSEGAYLFIWNDDEGKTDEKLWVHMGDPAGDKFGIFDCGTEIVPIGYILKDKDRLIINGDMIRYLTPYNRQMKDISARKTDRRNHRWKNVMNS